MAALRLIENEFYEIKNMHATEPNHRFHRLRNIRIIMISKIMENRVVFKWASINSLAYFFKEKHSILPKLDQEDDNLSRDEANLLLNGYINKVDLCFVFSTPQHWLRDDEARENVNVVMGTIGIEHLQEINRTKLKSDEFYSISYFDVPPHMKTAVGFVRVAMVYHGENDDKYVDVRVPSEASLQIYLEHLTSSFLFPCFDQVFELSRVAAKLFLKRNLPLQLCYELRQRRGFWIDEYAEGLNNFLA